jgi:hypothetical protein
VYVVYVLVTIRCSSIRAFARKMIGMREFEAFFYKMKTARTWFRLELMGIGPSGAKRMRFGK